MKFKLLYQIIIQAQLRICHETLMNIIRKAQSKNTITFTLMTNSIYVRSLWFISISN